MDSVATAPLKVNMGSSTIYTKRGEETIPFFSEPSATKKPEPAKGLLGWLYGPFLLAAAEIKG